MKKYLLGLLITMTVTTAQAQLLAVETDMAADALMVPNLGFELVTGERTTLGLHAFYSSKPWWESDTKKILGVQPEFRYFFSGRPMHKHFVGIGGVAATYNMAWKGKVYDGMAGGIGLVFGYVFNLTKRLNIDAHAGFGVIAYKHKEYFKYDNYDTDYSIGGQVRANAVGYYVLPTRIGVSLTYILK